MPIDFSPYSLADYFLIATPNLDDTYFSQSLVYICEHNAAGALGLRVNEPLDISIDELLHRMHIDTPLGSLGDMPVLNGGPMQSERGFVLHEQQTAREITFVDMKAVPLTANTTGAEPVVEELKSFYQSSLTIPGGREMTTSKDVLEALSSGDRRAHV